MSTEPFDDTGRDPDDSGLDESELDRALAEQDAELAVQLRALLDPDADLGERTAQDVDRALRSRNTVGAALDVLGVGWWTVRALLTDDRPPADRRTEGR